MCKVFPRKHFLDQKSKKSSIMKNSKKIKHSSWQTKEECMIDRSKLFIGSKFAHGAHSQLFHGTYNVEPVAVKIILAPEQEQEQEDYDDDHELAARVLERQFNQEVSLLSRLHHPNVIKLVGAYKQSPALCIVTEYLSEGSLRGYLNNLEHNKTQLSLQKLVAIALEIARGMEYVHSKGVIHRDLKPENVLIDEGFHMKIADFGVAREEKGGDYDGDEGGTYRWMAPEMIKRRSYNRKVDVYSFGLVLYEMVCGKVPYEGMNPVQAAYAVANKDLRPVLPEECQPLMRDLIESCWSSKPKKRPEFGEIVKVLEQFESSLACDGTLKLGPVSQSQKKGCFHWIFHRGSQVYAFS